MFTGKISNDTDFCNDKYVSLCHLKVTAPPPEGEAGEGTIINPKLEYIYRQKIMSLLQGKKQTVLNFFKTTIVTTRRKLKNV